MKIPDYLIIDDIKRRKERSWEPEALKLPLYIPGLPEERRDERKKDDKERPSSGVIIIDLDSYERIL